MIKIAFTLLALLTFQNQSALAQKNLELRSVVIMTKNFVAGFSSEAAAKKAVLAQNSALNESFARQAIPLSNKLVAFEVEDIGPTDGTPQNIATEFEGDDHHMVDANPEIAKISTHRLAHKADIVIVMTKFDSPFFKADQNYGVCAAFQPALRQDSTKHHLDSDPSLIIVDYLGLQTLTYLHEFGHAIGLDHHEYAKLDSSSATLMIANGNPQKLKRAAYWSDKNFKVKGKALQPTEGIDDVTQIRENLGRLQNRFKRWSELKSAVNQN